MIHNLGPRIKQIRRLRNDATVPDNSDILGSTTTQADWISPGELDDFVVPSIIGGRITTGNNASTPGDPVTGSTLGTATPYLWYVPYKHSVISLYNGSEWQYHRFDSFVIDIGNASNIVNGSFANTTNYDVYVYDNGGTLSMELAAWADSTPDLSSRDPSYTPVRLDGVLVGNFDNTRRYVGTIRSYTFNGIVIPKTETVGPRDLFGVWNYYNQVKQNLAFPLSISTNPSYVTTGAPTLLAGNGTPILFISGFRSEMRTSFTLRIQMIAVGGTGTINQSVPDYRARTGCSMRFGGSAANIIGWRPIDTLGSTSNSQDRVLHINKCAGRFSMGPGAHTLQHLYPTPLTVP